MRRPVLPGLLSDAYTTHKLCPSGDPRRQVAILRDASAVGRARCEWRGSRYDVA